MLFKDALPDNQDQLDPFFPALQQLINDSRVSIKLLLMQCQILIAKATIESIKVKTIQTLWLVIHTTSTEYGNWKPAVNSIQDLLDNKTGSECAILVEIRNGARMYRDLFHTVEAFNNRPSSKDRPRFHGDLALYLSGLNPRYAHHYPWATKEEYEDRDAYKLKPRELITPAEFHLKSILEVLEKNIMTETPEKLVSSFQFRHTPGMGTEYKLTLFVFFGDEAIAKWSKGTLLLFHNLSPSLSRKGRDHVQANNLAS